MEHGWHWCNWFSLIFLSVLIRIIRVICVLFFKKLPMSKFPIRFFSEEIKFSLANKNDLRKWILKTILKEGYKLEELNFVFCSDKYLLQLNKKFLKHNTLTDVITFNYSETTQKISGEIYISIERIKENAKKFNSTFKNELHRVIIHGVLHLCGFSDKYPSRKSQMKRKEDYYLKHYFYNKKTS